MLQVSELIRTPSARNNRNPMQVNHNFPQPSKTSSVHTIKIIQLPTSKKSKNRTSRTAGFRNYSNTAVRPLTISAIKISVS